MEKVYLNSADVVNELTDVIPVATTEKNGLKPASEVRMENMIQTTVSRVVYESTRTTSISTSLLISIAIHGGGPMILFYMTVYRSEGVLKKPTIVLNRLGGADTPTTPRFKIWGDENTGAFKIFFERTQYTPAIYVKILNTTTPSSDVIPLSAAVQDEVDAATYIDVT